MSKEQIIKFLKNKNNALIVVILIIGVIIMMSAGGESSKKTEPELEGISYAKELENILADLEGAGKVKVLITYYGTSQ